jgi:peptide deformylase
MLEVLKYPNPKLALRAQPVTQFDTDLRKTVEQMFATMYAEDGCGLAAIQVGIQQKIIVIDISNDGNEPLILINPEITSTSGSQTSDEGCLSFPGLRINVTTPN